MISTPKLNFPAIKLRAKEEDGHTLVFDCIRQIYIVLTPEEWVRRHLVEFLISHCKVAITNIIEEHGTKSRCGGDGTRCPATTFG